MYDLQLVQLDGSRYKDLLARSYFFKSVCVLSGFSLNPFRFMPVKTRLGDLAFLIVKILVCTTDSKNTKWSARSTSLETLWPCLGLLVQPRLFSAQVCKDINLRVKEADEPLFKKDKSSSMRALSTGY